MQIAPLPTDRSLANLCSANVRDHGSAKCQRGLESEGSGHRRTARIKGFEHAQRRKQKQQGGRSDVAEAGALLLAMRGPMPRID